MPTTFGLPGGGGGGGGSSSVGATGIAALAAQQNETLARIFSQLRSKDEKVRLEAGKELGQHVAHLSTELRGDALSVISNDLNRRIFELTHSPLSHEKLGGITAIESLIVLESEDNSARLYRFYQYLKPNLPCNDVTVMVAAARALGESAAGTTWRGIERKRDWADLTTTHSKGRVSKFGGQSLGDQFIEFEVLRALDFLQGGDRNEGARYAAVLIIREMANNVPHLFHVYVGRVLDRIWVALRDARVLVREGAAEALGACLQIIASREKQMGTQAYEMIYEEAERGLKMVPTEVIHGSLLAIQELLQHSKIFMRSRFHRACEMIFRLYRHRDLLIRRTITTLVPVLANYDPQYFAEKHLGSVMTMFTEQLRRDKDRTAPPRESAAQTFEAMGLVAAAMGSRMKPYIEQILACVKDGLQNKGRKNSVPEAPIFICIGYLATAVGPHLTKYMHELLDLMFACGLSMHLVQALERLVISVPPLLRNVQGE